MPDDTPHQPADVSDSRVWLETILEAASLIDAPQTDPPPPESFKENHDAWWWRVAVFRFANQMAITTDYEEQFANMFDDPYYASNFDIQIELYDKVLRRWAFSGLPESIEQWVKEDIVATDIEFNRRRRFEYVLCRRQAIEWWRIRASLEQTPAVQELTARQFMAVMPFFNIAADKPRDVEFFKAIIKPRTHSSSRRRVFRAAHYIRCYWLSWGLWDLSHTERTALINRKSGLPPENSFTTQAVRAAVKEMGFPQK